MRERLAQAQSAMPAPRDDAEREPETVALSSDAVAHVRRWLEYARAAGAPRD